MTDEQRHLDDQRPDDITPQELLLSILDLHQKTMRVYSEQHPDL